VAGVAIITIADTSANNPAASQTRTMLIVSSLQACAQTAQNPVAPQWACGLDLKME
jgi:hypothetical protein